MARDMTPVLKKCRALGIEPAFLGVEKKESKKHGAARPRKMSEYGMQLKEKQKAKFIYGVLEKPFRNYFEKAQKLKYGTTGENLMILLETRLDNVLFRMGLARTRDEARQIVSHREVKVNGKIVNIPSYAVKVGDVVEIKEKAKFIYGVLEKPFRNYFEKAQKLKYGTTGENLMILLETRLDNVIFRMGLARTRDEARQIVSHRGVKVNGKIVNIPSFAVKVGDVIEIKEGVKSSQRFKDIIEVTGSRANPAWVEADSDKLCGKILAIPTRDQIEVPVNEVAIVELYSK